MSRVGKKPIIIPSSVEVSIDEQTVRVKGPNGALEETLNSSVQVVLVEEDGKKEIHIQVQNPENKFERAQWGTARSLVQNMVQGAVESFERKLEVNGVGYRVNMQGKNLLLNLGFSHDVPVEIPEGVVAFVEGNIISIKGANKQIVGETAAKIRRLRKPEPYKGKGVKYIEEVIRRKSGKSQKAGG